MINSHWTQYNIKILTEVATLSNQIEVQGKTTRRFLGMTKMLLEASQKLFRWVFGANMFAGMSSQIFGEKFGI